jgi:hypothetical protein
VDLSFRFDRDVAVMTAIPTELAVLMVGIAARQAASPTAQLQASLDRSEPAGGLLTPAHGAFNRVTEVVLSGGTGPLPHPATQRQDHMGGRPSGENVPRTFSSPGERERAGAASPNAALTGWQEQ